MGFKGLGKDGVFRLCFQTEPSQRSKAPSQGRPLAGNTVDVVCVDSESHAIVLVCQLIFYLYICHIKQ